MGDGWTVASRKSILKDLLLGPAGVVAGLISIVIVLVLSFEPVGFLSQIVLFLLFVAFALFIVSHQLLFERICKGYVEDRARGENRVVMDFLPIKLVDVIYLIGFLVWKLAIVILFFVRSFGYLGFASAVVVVFDLFLFYESWKRVRRLNGVYV